MQRTPYTLLACIGAIAPIASCGDDEDTSTTTSTSVASSSTGTGGDPNCGPHAACDAPEPAQPSDMAQVGTVTATLLDQYDAVASQVNAAICGINVCGDIIDSDDAGNLSVNGTGLDFIAPRFSVGYNGKGYAKLTAPIPTTNDFGTIRVIAMPMLNMGVDLVPGQDATQSNVTLGVPTGADIKFDCLTFAVGERKFVAAAVDIAGWTLPDDAPAIDPNLNLDMLIALGPLDTHICPSASLTFPKHASWPAGAAIDIYIHGTKTYAHYAPYGGWAKVAEAVVNADGTVTTLDGQGIELLGTYGAALQ